MRMAYPLAIYANGLNGRKLTSLCGGTLNWGTAGQFDLQLNYCKRFNFFW